MTTRSTWLLGIGFLLALLAGVLNGVLNSAYAESEEELDLPVLQGFSCYKALVVTTTHDEWRGTRGIIRIVGSNGSYADVRLSPQLDGKTWIGNYTCPDSLHVEYTAISGYLIDGKKIPILGMPVSCNYWKRLFLTFIGR